MKNSLLESNCEERKKAETHQSQLSDTDQAHHTKETDLSSPSTRTHPRLKSTIAEENEQDDDSPSTSPTPATDAPKSESDATANESDKLQTKKGKSEIKRKKPKRGVVYLSRLPPNIEITSVRNLLSRTGRITNLWLRPETREQQKQRMSLGGSRRRTTFRDGWVEYSSRNDARETVALLNGRPMAGLKRKGRWANDLWCMKFLPAFEWRHLTAEVFGGRERILKVREEMAAARQERNWVEERARLSERLRRNGENGENAQPVRRFVQKRPVPETPFDDDIDEKRAREAAARVDEELETGKQAPVLSEDLVRLLVNTRKPKPAGS
ncbi:Pre-rRNA-processing protein ESF2 [Gracilariopsis chorda]|uniref:Pre-rRNA-processing protein ESF2 n=1 Tax=Gracilariopsis chorda TaxID=448386 RepID=A0A2V3J192_9FLOR|nr:Pre-rRNA-processing protein ESF2 [Gracilariopsis chorda]|eukprot:PXF47150.1 Pre-rRNA-processing protein ESF2 [Gracilariopsis chorda]